MDELEQLAASAGRERDRLIIVVMEYCGLRAGEVGGLRVRYVDFEKCHPRLRQQVVRAGTVKHAANEHNAPDAWAAAA